MSGREDFVETALGRFTPDSLQFVRLCAIAEAPQLRLMSWAMDHLPGIAEVLDIGANLGAYAVFLGQHEACQHIHAFEPTPETATEFQRNMALNFSDADSRVTLHRMAASDAAGEVKLGVGRPFDTGNRIMGARARNPGRTIAVPVCRIDDVIANGPRNMLMKIDVEGHELQVLGGAGSTVANRVAFAQIESWPQRTRRADVRAIMADHGFDFLLRIKGDQMFLHRDLTASADALKEVHAAHMDGMLNLAGWLARDGGKVLHDPAFRAEAVAQYNGLEQIRIGSLWQRLRRMIGGSHG